MRFKKSKSVFITGVEDGSDYRIGVYPLWRLKQSLYFFMVVTEIAIQYFESHFSNIAPAGIEHQPYGGRIYPKISMASYYECQ